jgi:aspartyl-tRNA(Asn)/glutamyl-tRNA(Gln) amidotransferase subunit B
LKLIQAKEISDRAADLLLRELVLKPQNPKKLAEKLNLLNLTEDELSKLINIVLKKNKDSVDQYKKGKTKVLAFLIGQVIRESKGRADAKIVKELIMKKSFLY